MRAGLKPAYARLHRHRRRCRRPRHDPTESRADRLSWSRSSSSSSSLSAVREETTKTTADARNGVSLVSVAGCENLRQTFRESNLVSTLPVRRCATFFSGRVGESTLARSLARACQEERPCFSCSPRGFTRNNKRRPISGVHQPRAPRGFRRQDHGAWSIVGQQDRWMGKWSDGAS